MNKIFFESLMYTMFVAFVAGGVRMAVNGAVFGLLLIIPAVLCLIGAAVSKSRD